MQLLFQQIALQTLHHKKSNHQLSSVRLEGHFLFFYHGIYHVSVIMVSRTLFSPWLFMTVLTHSGNSKSSTSGWPSKLSEIKLMALLSFPSKFHYICKKVSCLCSRSPILITSPRYKSISFLQIRLPPN